MNEVVLDIETKHTFTEVNNVLPNLKVSVVGIYNYQNEKFMIFEEHELKALEEILKSASRIIGFNIIKFDMAVLAPYLSINTENLPFVDIMVEIMKVVGHRVSLNSVAKATLGTQKSGDGLDAIRFFREGNMESLKKYCLEDVRITKEIYEYGKANRKVSFTSSRQVGSVYSVPVAW